MDDMSGVDDIEDMPGMMSEEDMQSLEDVSDAEFEALWLDMMIEHHEGAIELAQSEQDDGIFEPALSVAEDVISTQTDEISVMEDLRGPLPQGRLVPRTLAPDVTWWTVSLTAEGPSRYLGADVTRAGGPNGGPLALRLSVFSRSVGWCGRAWPAGLGWFSRELTLVTVDGNAV